MTDALRLLAIIVAVCGLGACAASAPPAEQAKSVEGCQAVQRPAGVAIGAAPTFDIACGSSGARSGAGTGVEIKAGVFVLTSISQPVERDQIRAAAEAAARASSLTRDQAQRMTCRAGDWLETGGAGWRLTPCAVKLGGWPMVAVIAPTPFGLAQGELSPNALAALPALLTSMEAQAARPDAPRQPSAAPESWPQNAANWVTNSYGAAAAFNPADIERYRRRMAAGPVHNSQGDHLEAERAYREAMTIQLQMLPGDHPALIDVLLALAVEVSNQSRHEEAEALFRRADQIAAAARVDDSVRARLLSARSIGAGNKDDIDAAVRLAREASEIHRRRSGRGANQMSRGQVLNAVGDSSDFDYALALSAEAGVALRAKDVRGASNAINEALKLLNDNPALPAHWRPGFLMQASAVAQRMDRFTDAEQFLLTALDLRRAMLGDTRPTASVHFALGRLYRSQKMLKEALDSFRSGVRIVESAQLGRAELTIDRFSPYLNVLLDLSAQEPALRAGYEIEMFRASQLVQGPVAGEAIARTSALLAIEDPAISEMARAATDLKRRRDAALLEISTEAAKPADRRDRRKEVALVEEVKETGVRITEASAALRQAFPGFDRLNAPRAIAETDVLARLSPEEAMISFTFGREGGFAFLLHRGRTRSTAIELTLEELNTAVGRLRRPFNSSRGEVAPYDLEAAHRLFQDLMGPFKADLAGVKHLIVVPFGPLLALPPALMVTEPPRSPGDYINAAWLGRDRSLSIAPSVRAFVEMRAARALASAPRAFLGVADPPFRGPGPGSRSGSGPKLEEACRDNGVMAPALLRGLDPLPETAEELRRAGAALGARPEDMLIGAAATEEALRALPLDQYRVLYFATHGLLPGELKCQAQPGLALAPPTSDPERADRDGLLDASEVAALKLKADLVVLSACNTAGSGGGRFGGEALSGLAEAFFNAGARSLLVSHWQVPSEATMEMMSRVFAKLGANFDGGLSDAMEAAQTALRSNPRSAHPVFWAAFTLVGDGGKSLREIDSQIAAAP